MARSPYTLTQRGKKGIWHVRYTHPSGQRIFRSTGTADRTLATEWASKLHAETYRTSRLGEKPQRRWVEAVPRWLADKQAKRSLGKDMHNLRWLDPHLRGKTLDAIDSDLLAALLVQRMAEPRVKRDGRKDDRTTSRSTAEKMLALVRSILRAAHSWGWLDRVPAIRLEENGKPKEDYRWLTVSEAERLHRELAEHLRAPYLFALATGWREQNVLRLEWSRIDLHRRVAWVAGSQVKAKRAIGSPLNDQAMAVLASQKGKHARWVFPNEQGMPYNRGNNHGFKAAQRRARIAPLRWHDLRHTWASWHVMAGTSLRSLMELGGWRSYQSVLRYAHLSPEHLAVDAARLPTLATGAKMDQV
ncbi:MULTISPECIES: tyrosine-type recombinase/integrase [Xanthomonas]|uniref:Integrase n=1 Tax=Xanthomonas citri pv. vignicola TaxID=473426 RepID=A0AB33CNP3_XANCI|nr:MULTISPECIES: site-specific integrase [Xanthomonas]ASK91828.1 integrase [Xanthomonas citri pv. vignicola]